MGSVSPDSFPILLECKLMEILRYRRFEDVLKQRREAVVSEYSVPYN